MFATVLWSIYCVIASVAIAMTLREYLKNRQQKLVWVLMGVLSCLAWPMLILAALLMPRRNHG